MVGSSPEFVAFHLAAHACVAVSSRTRLASFAVCSRARDTSSTNSVPGRVENNLMATLNHEALSESRGLAGTRVMEVA